MKPIYEALSAALGPAGAKLDYEQIKATMPRIAEVLHRTTGDQDAVGPYPRQRGGRIDF